MNKSQIIAQNRYICGKYVGIIGCIRFAITNFMGIIRLDILKSKENK